MAKVAETLSLFDLEDVPGGLNNQKSMGTSKIDVVHMDFVEAESVNWTELFAGFDKLYAITYSSGIEFICSLLKNFQYAEIIFGFEDVINFKLQEIMAYQSKIIERLRTNLSVTKVDLLSRIDNGDLKLFVARQKLSHEKIYLMESEDGRQRVVMGSANMSYAAFTGQQRENICCLDGPKGFEWYKNSFDELKNSSSDSISKSALQLADADANLNEIPVMNTVKIKKLW